MLVGRDFIQTRMPAISGVPTHVVGNVGTRGATLRRLEEIRCPMTTFDRCSLPQQPASY